MAKYDENFVGEERTRKAFDIHGVDVSAMMEALDQTKGNVYLITKEGDKINLKSKLSQITGLFSLLQGGKIVDATIIAEDPEDESRLFRLNLFGVSEEE